MGELLFWILLLAGSAALFLQTFSFKQVAFLDPAMGPARFPQIILCILMSCLILLIVLRLAKREKGGMVLKELFTGVRLRFGLMILAYVLVLQRLGFILSTGLFLAGSTTYLYYVENKRVPARLTAARTVIIFCFCVGMQLLFSRLMGVLLPRGILAF